MPVAMKDLRCEGPAALVMFRTVSFTAATTERRASLRTVLSAFYRMMVRQVLTEKVG